MKKWTVLLALLALMLTACAGSDTASATTAPKAPKTEVDISCPFLTIENLFTQDEGLHVKVTNECAVAIHDVRVYTLWYDEAGQPVDIGGTVAPNVTKDALTEIDAASSAIFIIPTEKGSAQVKQAVAAVYFTDGTVWENENMDAWLAEITGN